MSISSEEILINALNHGIRRDILRLLCERVMSFSALLDFFDITPGKLNYHLKMLTGFVEKNSDGHYQTSPLGIRAMDLLNGFLQSTSDGERPLLKQAYLSQTQQQQSFLRIRLIGGLYFKLLMIITVAALLIISAIMYANTGVDILAIWPIYFMGFVVIVGGLIWIYKQYGPAKEFTQRIDELIQPEH